MKDIIRREIKSSSFKRYELEVLAENQLPLFLPLSYEFDRDGDAIITYDVTETDPYDDRFSGSEAPRIIIEIMREMVRAMDYYIYPMDYLVAKKYTRIDKKGRMKLLFIPCNMEDKKEITAPFGFIRMIAVVFLRDLYESTKVEYYEVVKKCEEILRDKKIGFNTCIRRLEVLKEEVHIDTGIRHPQSLDFQQKII